ncbi:MAG: hypothetical protein M3332_08680 [Actinomycetota bacterium]|nr:hypothetical protein [Actinomycetota bacterium]
MSLFVAIIVAGVFSVFGFPFRYYQCWYSWSHLGTPLGIAVYLALAGAGGGFLGWGAAQLGGAQPTPNPALNGILYGIGGALALRADFRSRPRRNRVPNELRDTASILSTSMTWAANLLDDVAYRRALEWYGALSDRDLMKEARRICAHITTQPARIIPDKAKKGLLGEFVPAMESLTKSMTRDDGRARLSTFCAKYCIEEHMPKIRQELNARPVTTNGQALGDASSDGTTEGAPDDTAHGERRRPVLIQVAVWTGTVVGIALLGAGVAILIMIYGPKWTDETSVTKLPAIPTYRRADYQGVVGLHETPRPSPEEIGTPPYTVGPNTQLDIVCQVSNGTLVNVVLVTYAGEKREKENDIWYRIDPHGLYIPGVYTTYPDGVENKLPAGTPYGTKIPECVDVPP